MKFVCLFGGGGKKFACFAVILFLLTLSPRVAEAQWATVGASCSPNGILANSNGFLTCTNGVWAANSINVGNSLTISYPGTDVELNIYNTSSGAHEYSIVSTGNSLVGSPGQLTIYDQTTSHIPFQIQANGDVHIGGSSYAGGPGQYYNNLYVYGTSANCSFGTGTGAASCSSDRRLKKDIKPIENALDKILQIQGVTFYWKNTAKTKTEHIGVIAQDVEKVFPQAVGKLQDPDLGNVKTVDIAALVAPMIEAIRELKADNDTLRAEFETYKSVHP